MTSDEWAYEWSSLPRLCQKYPQRDILMVNMYTSEIMGGGNEVRDFPINRYLACSVKHVPIAMELE